MNLKNLLLATSILFLSNAAHSQKGCTEGDCTNGHGNYEYSNGDSYYGEWANDERNGEGRYYWKNGTHHNGNWLNNKKHGYGEYYNIKTKKTKKGFWKNGEYSGNVGCRREGRCENGYGTYLYGNAGTYIGLFKNGKRHGRGTFYYSEDESYDGNWVEDYREGYGRLELANGQIREGKWKRGILIRNELHLKWRYFDEKENKSKITDCSWIVNPFPNQPNFKQKFELSCKENWEPFGTWVLRYYDKVSDEVFLFSGDLKGSKYVTGFIYGFDHNDVPQKVFRTELEDGIVKSIISLDKSQKRRELLGSFLLAGFVAELNKNVSYAEAMGCALAFNIGKTINNSTTAAVLVEIVNTFSSKRNFSVKNISTDIIKSEIMQGLEENDFNSINNIDGLVSFLDCLLN